MTGKLRK